jgi:hypothetical protein
VKIAGQSRRLTVGSTAIERTQDGGFGIAAPARPDVSSQMYVESAEIIISFLES